VVPKANRVDMPTLRAGGTTLQEEGSLATLNAATPGGFGFRGEHWVRRTHSLGRIRCLVSHRRKWRCVVSSNYASGEGQCHLTIRPTGRAWSIAPWPNIAVARSVGEDVGHHHSNARRRSNMFKIAPWFLSSGVEYLVIIVGAIFFVRQFMRGA
jgi:hypothetical protein